jgi:hypothetical protein
MSEVTRTFLVPIKLAWDLAVHDTELPGTEHSADDCPNADITHTPVLYSASLLRCELLREHSAVGVPR